MTENIKFFWNGFKINGENKLIRCHYSLDNNLTGEESVSIHIRDCGGRLPRDLFEVRNETDIYTDYFDHDHAYITPEHPLWKYIRYAACRAEIRSLKASIKYAKSRLEDPRCWSRDMYLSDIPKFEAKLAEFEKMKNPGHPTAEDIKAIHDANLERENARLAAEHERQLREREAYLNARNEGKRYIEKIASEFPMVDSDPYVVIEWSEHPAFYAWEDGELELSIAAAEIILSHFDRENAAKENYGYDKTKFTVHFVNSDGEWDTYEGRYDLGDNDGGMIAHMRYFGNFLREKGGFGNGNPTEENIVRGNEIVAICDMLEGFTACAGADNVILFPGLEDMIRNYKDNH